MASTAVPAQDRVGGLDLLEGVLTIGHFGVKGGGLIDFKYEGDRLVRFGQL